MPNQNMPTHVVSGMIRPQLGKRLWFVYDDAMNPQVAAQRDLDNTLGAARADRVQVRS